MPGQGVAPKLPDQRRRTNAPARGEWIEIPKVGLGAPLGNPDWSARTRAAWDAWWNDPASTQWTPADVDSVRYLAELHNLGSPTIASEMRLRMDGLGLTQKGKRDLRWRIVEVEEEVEPKKPAKSRRRNLNVVA